jgi:hypothetical protein
VYTRHALCWHSLSGRVPSMTHVWCVSRVRVAIHGVRVWGGCECHGLPHSLTCSYTRITFSMCLCTGSLRGKRPRPWRSPCNKGSARHGTARHGTGRWGALWHAHTMVGR